jgi:hypothetical protein
MMGGFMKGMRASHTLYENSALEETEYALAISPCPQIEGSKDIGENTEFARKRSGLDRRRQAQSSRQTVFDNHDLTEALTIGWAIALAIAVALAVYVSGG